MVKLLSTDALERSDVVANCRMNRERTLTGGNGYAREIGFHPLDFLKRTISERGQARWLDLCCGTGRALIEAAQIAREERFEDQLIILGIDLVGMFDPIPAELRHLQILEASVTAWQPDCRFDLITCVHGLHYIGDKLGLIGKACTWLNQNGCFVATLDLDNIQFLDGN